MDISFLDTAVLTSFAVLTSVISALAGMAGGVLLLSLLSFYLPYSALIPIHGMTQLVSNSSRAWYLRDHIEWKIFVPFALGVPLGAGAVTLWVVGSMSERIPYFLISVLIFYTVFRPKKMPPLRLSSTGFFFLGAFAGGLGILMGATGPLLAPFFLGKELTKKNLIATQAAAQFSVHLVKIPSFLYLGFSFLDYGVLILLLGVGAIAGTRLGVQLLHRVSEKVFMIAFKTLLVLAALRLLYKAIGGLL